MRRSQLRTNIETKYISRAAGLLARSCIFYTLQEIHVEKSRVRLKDTGKWLQEIWPRPCKD